MVEQEKEGQEWDRKWLEELKADGECILLKENSGFENKGSEQKISSIATISKDFPHSVSQESQMTIKKKRGEVLEGERTT